MADRSQPNPRRKRSQASVRPVEAAAAHAEAEAFRREGAQKMPLGRKARDTRNRLLAAAYEQFSESGYRGTKADDIAARAGTSTGTFYQYFDSRADVMTSLVGESVQAMLSRPMWDWSEGLPSLRRMLRDFVTTYQATAAFQGVWEEATHVDDVPANVRRDLGRFITEAVEQELKRARDDGNLPEHLDPALLARALAAMVDRFCYLTYVFDPPAEPVAVDEAVDTLLYVWTASLRLPGGQ